MIRFRRQKKKERNKMKKESKDLFLAIVCTLLVFFALDYFFPRKPVSTVAVPSEEVAEQVVQKENLPTEVQNSANDAVLKIQSDTLSGEIRLRGAVFNKLTFLKYQETVAKDSPDVTFLSPSYYAYFGVNGSADLDVPNKDSVWSANTDVLTPTSPVTLSWTNAQGVVFNRTITLDDKYMFTITDSVQNNSDKAISVAHTGVLNRLNPALDGAVSVHQGFVGVFDGKLKEEKYASIEDETLTFDSNGGWMGLTDKYWLSAFAFNPALSGIQTKVSYLPEGKDKLFKARFETLTRKINAGEKAENVTYFFAGPKDLDLITAYEETLGIDKFELAIDFGWYYFLTKPFLHILSWLYGMVGNMGVAILIFATLLRILLLPIAGKSFESMAKMRKIQPRLAELQVRYKNDRLRLNQEMLALYKKEQVNPASGCLPMLIQIPVFFSLYKVLSVSIEMRQAPFFGWIHDLSVRDPSSVFTLFGLVPWPIPSFLNIGIWPVLMGITMYLQQKMNPQAAPASQQAADTMKMMKWMPVIFTFMMGNFASGLVIYWTWSNLLSIIQQRYVMRKYGVK